MRYDALGARGRARDAGDDADEGSQSDDEAATTRELARVAAGFYRSAAQCAAARTVGLDEAHRVLRARLLRPLAYPELFDSPLTTAGDAATLLFGPPGCGKTEFAQEVAHAGECAFFDVPPGALDSKWRGSATGLVRALFREAEHPTAPEAASQKAAVIFLDEVETLLESKETAEAHVTQVLNAVLAEMSRPRERPVLVIGATNYPWRIDAAARRRFKHQIHVGLPDLPAQVQILQNALDVHNRVSRAFRVTAAEGADAAVTAAHVAGQFAGWSGADIYGGTKELLCAHVDSCIDEHLASAGVGQPVVQNLQLGDLVQRLALCRRPTVEPRSLAQFAAYDEQYGTTTRAFLRPLLPGYVNVKGDCFLMALLQALCAGDAQLPRLLASPEAYTGDAHHASAAAEFWNRALAVLRPVQSADPVVLPAAAVAQLRGACKALGGCTTLDGEEEACGTLMRLLGCALPAPWWFRSGGRTVQWAASDEVPARAPPGAEWDVHPAVVVEHGAEDTLAAEWGQLVPVFDVWLELGEEEACGSIQEMLDAWLAPEPVPREYCARELFEPDAGAAVRYLCRPAAPPLGGVAGYYVSRQPGRRELHAGSEGPLPAGLVPFDAAAPVEGSYAAYPPGPEDPLTTGNLLCVRGPGGGEGIVLRGVETDHRGAPAELPTELWLLLKRWRPDLSKDTRPVELSPELRARGADYRLSRVVAHRGSTRAGHYTAWVLDAGVWTLYDNARRVCPTAADWAELPSTAFMVCYVLDAQDPEAVLRARLDAVGAVAARQRAERAELDRRAKDLEQREKNLARRRQRKGLTRWPTRSEAEVRGLQESGLLPAFEVAQAWFRGQDHTAASWEAAVAGTGLAQLVPHCSQPDLELLSAALVEAHRVASLAAKGLPPTYRGFVDERAVLVHSLHHAVMRAILRDAQAALRGALLDGVRALAAGRPAGAGGDLLALLPRLGLFSAAEEPPPSTQDQPDAQRARAATAGWGADQLIVAAVIADCPEALPLDARVAGRAGYFAKFHREKHPAKHTTPEAPLAPWAAVPGVVGQLPQPPPDLGPCREWVSQVARSHLAGGVVVRCPCTFLDGSAGTYTFWTTVGSYRNRDLCVEAEAEALLGNKKGTKAKFQALGWREGSEGCSWTRATSRVTELVVYLEGFHQGAGEELAGHVGSAWAFDGRLRAGTQAKLRAAAEFLLPDWQCGTPWPEGQRLAWAARLCEEAWVPEALASGPAGDLADTLRAVYANTHACCHTCLGPLARDAASAWQTAAAKARKWAPSATGRRWDHAACRRGEQAPTDLVPFLLGVARPGSVQPFAEEPQSPGPEVRGSPAKKRKRSAPGPEVPGPPAGKRSGAGPRGGP